ncbi:MAG: Cytochrome c554 and c-prime [Candidatus Electronema aureum]|uniref:Cytochrome c554 and c-prime n=1 Tax=Candidatus Electronema aureum TaxID=2005002 RepID=A0A521G083_9BACT|nr:MAG: Cytochrome c554 and c-prime [Candidatus Electronema aureum]
MLFFAKAKRQVLPHRFNNVEFLSEENAAMKPRFVLPAVVSLLCGLSAAQAHELPEGAAPLEKSEQCAACHPTIFQEWQESFHAKSSVHKDSAHKAMHQAFSKAMIAKGQKANYHCATCHAPMSDNLKALMSGEAEPDSSNTTQVEGVGCTFCHRIEAVNKGKSFDQYTLSKEGAYHTSRPANKKAPHQTATSPLFTDGQVCMGCHSQYVNPHEVPVCVMTEEGKGNCISCHMSPAEGSPAVGSAVKTHFSHRFPGGHDQDILQKAAALEVKIETKGKERSISVAIKNTTEHTFPSTNPMRMAFVKVRAKDKKGAVIWENFKADPLQEDKQAVFFKAFKAGEKVGVPSWEAEAMAFDTRLKTGETRTLTYPLYSPAISEVEVELFYLLFPPKAIEGFGIPKDGVNDKRYSVAKKSVKM